MKIVRIVGFRCEYCLKIMQTQKSIIKIEGQYEGRSDIDYSYHFCDILCLKLEIEKEKKKNIINNDYLYILENYHKKINKKTNGK